jgi:hypothetical protein
VVVKAGAAALLGLVLAGLAAPAGHAQRTTSDGLLGCERHAAVEFKRRNPAFRRFVIDRASVVVDRYADKIGSQFITTIYEGRASYDAGTGAKIVHFICLHGGVERGPLFVYALAD